jgi:3-oxoacyl-[acyl-carrier-protein] synthase II
MDVVITGMGVICPIGVGKEAFWQSLRAGRSGVGRVEFAEAAGLPCQLGAEVREFDPKLYVRPRKSLKVMARDTQLGVAAAEMARQDAGLSPGSVDPERFGVSLAADPMCNPLDEAAAPYRACTSSGRFAYELWGTEGMAASYPLAFLRICPNMIASHISIAQDARGPNNTIHENDVSSLLAIAEAAGVIRRGAADVMMAGGASSQMTPVDWIRRCLFRPLSSRHDDPPGAVRPFDADRSGMVWGEGAAIFILERRSHAEARGAGVLARLLGWSSCCEPRRNGRLAGRDGLRRAIVAALQNAGLDERDLGHVNAQGRSTVEHDRVEAQAIHDAVPSAPVTAPTSMFASLGAAGGAVELAASILSFQSGLVPATRNYERPDPQCPVEVVRGEPLAGSAPTAVSINWTDSGQVAALVVAGPN